MNGRRNADGGSAAVLVVAVIAVVASLTFAALHLAEVRVSRHRAAAAADLAAVAGASTWPAAPSVMCARAREVGRLNGAIVTDCRLDGRAVAVRVTVEAPGSLPRGALVSAWARAVRDPAPMGRQLATMTTRADRSVGRSRTAHPRAMPMAVP